MAKSSGATFSKIQVDIYIYIYIYIEPVVEILTKAIQQYFPVRLYMMVPSFQSG